MKENNYYLDFRVIIRSFVLRKLIFQHVQKLNNRSIEGDAQRGVTLLRWEELMCRPIHLLIQHKSIQLVKESMRLYAPYHRFLFDLLQVANAKRLAMGRNPSKLIDLAALHNSMELLLYFHNEFELDLMSTTAGHSQTKVSSCITDTLIGDFPKYARQSAMRAASIRFEVELEHTGGDIKERSFATKLAVAHAVKNNNFEMVKFLLENRSEGFDMTAIDNATKLGPFSNLKMIKYMHDKCPLAFGDGVAGCLGPFVSAVRGGFVQVAEWFIKHKYYFDPNRTNWLYIDWAANSRSLEMVKLMFKHGLVNTNWYNADLYTKISNRGDFDILEYLEKNRPPNIPSTINIEEIKRVSSNHIEQIGLFEKIKKGDIQVFKNDPSKIKLLDLGYSSHIFKYLGDSGDVDFFKILHQHNTHPGIYSSTEFFYGLVDRLLYLHYSGSLEPVRENGFLECLDYLLENKLISRLSFVEAATVHWSGDDDLLSRFPWISHSVGLIPEYKLFNIIHKNALKPAGYKRIIQMHLEQRTLGTPLFQGFSYAFQFDVDLIKSIYQLDQSPKLFAEFTLAGVLEKCNNPKVLSFLVKNNVIQFPPGDSISSLFLTQTMPVQNLIHQFNKHQEYQPEAERTTSSSIFDQHPNQIYLSLVHAISKYNFKSINYILKNSPIQPLVVIKRTLSHLNPSDTLLSGREPSVWTKFYSIYILLLSYGMDLHDFYYLLKLPLSVYTANDI
ncbi:hypothetical protein DFA_04911 [Cavenderia fasciculata]|uniref:Ankyrin repeat-containing protein n=1 Tax=Cavenderia fasciculata TaxID=261658 RepID=F4PMD1_CACFS|nr:uncharacterized protein DFA_04911 [Cavenderia fasciculata]EGG22781.1 hypothetical protein DFA_04911 [Cavenderia fasciculata]|eukprot:XP_004360632.1 hypothetical protein DFA_04911 [Cavenderia fasciculata]